jgi:pimeloyl-ACP methyl ester carboxylesterase
LHGSGLTRRWLPLYEALSESVDLIVPEHPGYGDTPLPEWLDGFDDLVLHYDALLDLLELERPHLVGHSLGGRIAANLAIFYPKRFASLTLITPAGLRLPDVESGADVFRLSPAERPDCLLNGHGDRYAEYFMEEEGTEGMIHRYSESITTARLTWNPRYDYKFDERLPRVAVPTLVLVPDEDRILPTEAGEAWASLIPGARTERIQGTDDEPTGHLVIIQQPEQVAGAISRHVAEAAA